MDILTALDRKTDYSATKLQFIVGAWVASSVFERKEKISTLNGDVSEDDYDKQSIYSLLYSIYKSLGTVRSDTGERYEVTFNTWGYAWPKNWGPVPTDDHDPQRHGRNAYSGLFQFQQVQQYIAAREGQVHLIEMGCGTGAGAHHICKSVLPKATYAAFDMQYAAIQTCRSKFVPELEGRLTATCDDCTKMPTTAGSADIVVVCETHVTEMPGVITDEDKRFFDAAQRMLKPGGFLVWGNAIPDSTWQPCFAYLESIGMQQREVQDVTREAIVARDEDAGRVNAFVDQCLDRFHGFKMPLVGAKRRHEASLAMKNFYRNPGTNLYQTMVDGSDTYKVVLFQKSP
jgi:ubiquinone/menaquinone biosynthesis C-methylase UbiE